MINIVEETITLCLYVRKRGLREPEEARKVAMMRKQRRVARASSQSIEEASQAFAAALKEGPDYVCTCCHRLMYRKTVIEFRPAKYMKLSEELLHQVFSPAYIYRSAQDKVWLCTTCDYSLKRGNMPAQAKANNLALEPVPLELQDLNPMEVRLVSLRIPFMKMVALPCGKQKAIHGPAVNVPADLCPVCDLLPRLPSQTQIVPMKLKRKLCYKGHYMYDFIQPAKVIAALEWLKSNNPLYIDIGINRQWVEDAAGDNSELWEAMSSHQCQQQSHSSDSSQPDQLHSSLQSHQDSPHSKQTRNYLVDFSAFG